MAKGPAGWSHVASLAVMIGSREEDGSDLDPAALRAAVVARLDELGDDAEAWEQALRVHDRIPVPDARLLPSPGRRPLLATG